MVFSSFVFYVLFTVIIIIVFICFLINRSINRNTVFGTWQKIFLFFIIFHSVYIFIVHAFFYDTVLLNIAAPFYLFYAPFYYFALYALIAGIGFSILKHLYIGILLILLYALIIIFFKNDEILQFWYRSVLYVVTILQSIFYGIICYVDYTRYNVNSMIASILNQYIILLVVVALFFIGLLTSDSGRVSNESKDIMIYVLIITALLILLKYNFSIIKKIMERQYQKFNEKNWQHWKLRKSNGLSDHYNREDTKDASKLKYQKSRIKEDDIEEYVRKVQKSLNENIYLDSELTLETLSEKLKIPKYHLTQVFSLGFNSNFNKLINQYRIQYAIKLLEHTQDKLTIEEIGMKSGFSSRSSFYRTFSIYNDRSPVDYKKEILEKRNIK